MFFRRKPKTPSILCSISEDCTGTYHLNVDIVGNTPIHVSSEDRRNLQRLSEIIRTNEYTHAKAQSLCRTVQLQEIKQGNLPEHTYGDYLVVIYLKASTGSICGKYLTADEAYQDPCIQRTIRDMAGQYDYTPDYEAYLEAVEKGAYCTYGAYTILRGRVTRSGLVRPVPTN